MTTLTEGRYAAEFLISEAPNTISRDVETIIAGQNVGPGTVMGRITASGKLTQLAPAASDGSQTAAAITFDIVNATAADKAGVVIARTAEVASAALVWPAGITGPQKTTALAQLKALGVTAR